MNTQDREAMGKRVREARMRHELTQSDLGQKIGVSASYIQEIEEGLVLMDLEALIGICNVLSLWPNYVLGLSDDNPQNTSPLLN